VGKVTKDGIVRIRMNGNLLPKFRQDPLLMKAHYVTRPYKKASYIDEVQKFNTKKIEGS